MLLLVQNATLIVQLAPMETINQIATHVRLEKSKILRVSQRTQSIAEIPVLLRLTRTMVLVKVGFHIFTVYLIKIACDPLCDGCTGAGNTSCSACDSSAKSVDGVPNKCVAHCSDHASNFF